MTSGGPSSEVWGVVVAVAGIVIVIGSARCAWRSYARRRRLASARAALGWLGCDQALGRAGWAPRAIAAAVGGTAGACLGLLLGAQHGLGEAIFGGAIAGGVGAVAGWFNVALATDR